MEFREAIKGCGHLYEGNRQIDGGASLQYLSDAPEAPPEKIKFEAKSRSEGQVVHRQYLGKQMCDDCL